MNALGIMQGRLCPPEDGRFQSFPKFGWADEFERAKLAGLDAIEWIWDAYGQDLNPLASDPGVAEMRAHSSRHQVAVRSVCADYFMDFPLVCEGDADRTQRLEALTWLIDRCAKAGIGRIVLPFVDASRMVTAADRLQVIAAVKAVLPQAAESGVELHLETDLAPADFAELLAQLPAANVFVNYDSGNSASLGYRPAEEFAAYGDRVGSVHLKDRVLNGGTVALGAGDTDFESLASALRAADYRGDFILQAARGVAGDEVAWARRNRDFSEAHVLARLRA